MSDTPTIAEKILALPLGEPAMRVPVYLDKLDFSLGGFIAGQMIDIRSRAATLAAEREAEQAQRIADLSAALARNAATRFAGWFHELPSGMSYRLWEQGGHDQQPGEVALYEADDGAAQRIAELEAENAALRADAERYRWLRSATNSWLDKLCNHGLAEAVKRNRGGAADPLLRNR